MSILEFLFYSLITGFIFILFFVIISIFGNIFLTIIDKIMKDRGIDNNATYLEKLILSFGIGILIYISFCFYLILIGIYTIYFAYYAILVFDIFFIIYLINYKYKITKKKIFEYARAFLKKYLKKDLVIKFLIFSFTLILGLILYIDIITKNIGLLSKDPYFWLMKTELALRNENIIDFNKPWYPRGFAIVNAGFLFPFSEPRISYYFIKIAPIFYLVLFYIIAYTIFSKFFTKKYLFLISFSLILISGNFLSRTLINLPSSLASILISIFIVGLINNYQKFISGIFIGGISLFHPLSSLFFILILFFYVLINTILKRSRKIKFSFLKSSIFYILFIPLIMIIPYILNFKLSTLITVVIERLQKIIGIKNIHSPYFKNRLNLLQLFSPISFNLFDLYANPFAFYFLISLIGSVIYLKDFKKLDKERIFIIVSIFTALLIYFLPNLLQIFFSLNSEFLYRFNERIFENLIIQFIITITFTIEWILEICRIIYYKILNKFYKIKKILKKNKILKKYFNSSSLLIILIVPNIYNLYLTRANIFFEYNYDEDLLDIILYLRKNSQLGESIFLSENLDLPKKQRDYLLNNLEIHFYRIYGGDIPSLIFYKDFDYLMIKNKNSEEYHKFPNYNNSKLVYSNNKYSLYEKLFKNQIFEGTYDFLNDEVGTKGRNISFVQYQEPYVSTEIIEIKSQHSKVLKGEIYERYNGFINFFNPKVKEGIIELWMYLIKGNVYISIMDNSPYKEGINRIMFGLTKHNDIKYFYNNSRFSSLERIFKAQWIHLKIKFNSTNWHLWIDGYKTNKNGYEFQGSPEIFYHMKFIAYDKNTSFYLDAVNYSWI